MTNIDTGPLAGAFRDMTASYKAFWFLSLVGAVAERAAQTPIDLQVPFEEMAQRMLKAAYWPAVTYRLWFGSQDRIHERLATLRDDDGNEVQPTLSAERGRGILRYVPEKFLSPWLSAATSGTSRPSIDELSGIPGKLPYRILRTGIEMDHLWFEHIADNSGVMRALGERELIRYLQSRNPNIPGIPDKIGPPDRSGGLGAQKRFWQAANGNGTPICFYSGTPLIGRAFSLDHFIPWSFVTHDRIWNLVPMAAALNSSKGVRLPDEAFVDRMGHTHLAIVRSALTFGQTDIFRRLGEYEGDLRINLGTAGDEEFLAAHRDAMVPLMALARRSGFTGKWHPPQRAHNF